MTSTVRSVNLGAKGFVAAFLAGILSPDVTTDDIAERFPGGPQQGQLVHRLLDMRRAHLRGRAAEGRNDRLARRLDCRYGRAIDGCAAAVLPRRHHVLDRNQLRRNPFGRGVPTGGLYRRRVVISQRGRRCSASSLPPDADLRRDRRRGRSCLGLGAARFPAGSDVNRIRCGATSQPIERTRNNTRRCSATDDAAIG